MAMKRVKLIISPVSRPAWVKRYVPSVLNRLREGGLEVEEELTRDPGDPARLARASRDRFDAVIMAGGDGSINETMNALCGSDTPVGILPFGTTNVFAREMRIPLNPLAAAEAFLKGRVKTFDMGMLGERRFLLMASYGFDAMALRRNREFLKRVFGRYSYVLAGIGGWPFYRDVPIEVYIDDAEEPETVNFAVFSNSKCYAGDFQVAPRADMHDGLLDVTLFYTRGRLGVAKAFVGIFTGTHVKKPWVKMLRARKIRFKTAAMELFQIDGDFVDAEGSEITVQDSAIRVVVPEKSL